MRRTTSEMLICKRAASRFRNSSCGEVKLTILFIIAIGTI